jgi:hypothetical protein
MAPRLLDPAVDAPPPPPPTPSTAPTPRTTAPRAPRRPPPAPLPPPPAPAPKTEEGEGGQCKLALQLICTQLMECRPNMTSNLHNVGSLPQPLATTCASEKHAHKTVPRIQLHDEPAGPASAAAAALAPSGAAARGERKKVLMNFMRLRGRRRTGLSAPRRL